MSSHRNDLPEPPKARSPRP